jgi:hypothetical protein
LERVCLGGLFRVEFAWWDVGMLIVWERGVGCGWFYGREGYMGILLAGCLGGEGFSGGWVAAAARGANMAGRWSAARCRRGWRDLGPGAVARWLGATGMDGWMDGRKGGFI